MGMGVSRFEVYLVSLDPTRGHEMQKTRPYLVISPDEMNRHIATVIIAPMTTRSRDYPTRITCTFQGKHAHIVLDKIRTIDASRLIRKLGTISATTQQKVLDVLTEMFAP